MRASLLQRLYPYLELNQRQGSAYLRRFFGQPLETPDLPYFSHVPRWSTTARIKDFYAEDFGAHLRDDAIETLHAFADAGLTEIALRVHDDPAAAIRLIGERVMPAMR